MEDPNVAASEATLVCNIYIYGLGYIGGVGELSCVVNGDRYARRVETLTYEGVGKMLKNQSIFQRLSQTHRRCNDATDALHKSSQAFCVLLL